LFRALRGFVVVFVIIAHFGSINQSYAQNALSLRIDSIDASKFPEVAVSVTLRDERNVPLPGLSPEQIEILEDRIVVASVDRVVPIHHGETPVTILLAIDISRSMSGAALVNAKSAVRQLLEIMHPNDAVALLAFSDSVERDFPLQLDPQREFDFTSDFMALADFVDRLEADGTTPLYDATWKAIERTARQPSGNRAVILLTDGRDEVLGGVIGSGSSLADDDMPIRTADRYGVPVFTIGLGQNIDAGWLQRLAVETGGSFVSTPDSEELPAIFRAVLMQLKQRFQIVYRSSIDDPEIERRVQVVVRAGSAKSDDEVVLSLIHI
jgi:VWFA-related protein